MRRMTIALAAAALVVGSIGISAQTPPSFAGKWTLVPDPNVAAGGGGGGGRAGGRGGGFGSICAQECTITQDAKMVTVTRTTQAGEVKSMYNLDGTESKNTMTMGENQMTSMSTAKWDGSKLVITTKQDMQGTMIESKNVLSLDAGGQLVVARTAPGRGDPTPVTTTQTYKKS